MAVYERSKDATKFKMSGDCVAQKRMTSQYLRIIQGWKVFGCIYLSSVINE